MLATSPTTESARPITADLLELADLCQDLAGLLPEAALEPSELLRVGLLVRAVRHPLEEAAELVSQAEPVGVG